MRSLARALIGQANLGSLDYFRFANRRSSWGGPFNGQSGRQAIFTSILSAIAPAMIVETGTFRGTTTAFMARSGVPIVTIEAVPRFYGFARMQLWRFGNVDLRLGDSRVEARRAMARYVERAATGPLFAYLDAHWYNDLPLLDELDIIFSACPGAVVMIDDFQVPDDPGYGFDDYGAGRALDLAYIASRIDRYGLTALYPALESAEESGARRGCVVLVNDRQWRSVFLTIAELRSGRADATASARDARMASA